jgi:uncharacterized YccA/Bax inhibitor family protein
MATRSKNPVLSRMDFDDANLATSAERMTLGGVVRKTGVLLAILTATAAWGWMQVAGGQGVANYGVLLLVAVLGGFGVAVYTSFHPERARLTGPLYAALEGLFLGALSATINAQYRGLPLLAVALSIVTLGVMLVLYRAGVIRATERFRAVVVGCTLAIMIFYLLAFVASFFDLAPPFILGGGVIGIGFSLFVTALAAFNLILDFDLIERGIGHAGAEYEWFAAFGLVVTLVWLYIEFLRLLRKLRR